MNSFILLEFFQKDNYWNLNEIVILIKQTTKYKYFKNNDQLKKYLNEIF